MSDGQCSIQAFQMNNKGSPGNLHHLLGFFSKATDTPKEKGVGVGEQWFVSMKNVRDLSLCVKYSQRDTADH